MAAVRSSPVTATETAALPALDAPTSQLLEDYEIHHSSKSAEDSRSSEHEHHGLITVVGVQRPRQPPLFDPTLAPHPRVPYLVSNPPWWDGDHRRVPDYRPVNRELDREQRRQNPLFTVVGAIMLGGCSLIANWSFVWRNTIGRFTDYGVGKVGGEF